MSWQRWLTLMLLFCIDVHVKAEAPKARGCWGKAVPCVVNARRHQVLKAKDLTVALAPSSLIEQRDEKTVQLVTGHFYAETSRPVAFNTPYAKVVCEDSCRGLFVREKTQFNVKAIAGRWTVKRTGDQKTYGIPVGMQMTFGEVMDDGMAQMDFPQSLPWDATLKLWVSLYPGELKEFKPVLSEFREDWREAVERVSEMHKSQAARTIASHERELAEARSQQAAREREDAQLRALFREKNP